MSVSRVLRARAVETGAGEEVAGRPAETASRRTGLRMLGLALLVMAAAGCGVGEDLPENPINVIAEPVSLRVQLPNGDTIERRQLVDGDATDAEWGTVPFQFVAMGPEHGNGGGSFVASLKVAHDSARVYVMVQWPDDFPDALGPRLVFAPSRGLNPGDCDSLLVTCSWRLDDPDEDRLAIMWDLGNAADGGGTFKDRGCQVACHGSMHPLAGAVDIWQWRAARTNAIQYPFPGSSLRVGFAEDGYADASSRTLDPGSPFYRDNYRYVDCGGGERAPVPLEIAIALDNNNQPTTRINDFMRPCEYIYDPAGVTFSECSRENPCRQFNQDDVERWVAGDDVAAFLTNRPAGEPQRQSLHDVEARGRWVGEAQGGVWTVEMSRTLRTSRPEDRDLLVGTAEPYYMALAIMNHAGRIHSGSPVMQITLRP